MDRLEVICDEGKNEIILMNEEGISILGEFKISNGKVIYHHKNTEVGYTIGMLHENYLSCIRPEDCNAKGMVFKFKGRYLVYLVNKKPRYILNLENGVVAVVDTE